MSMLTAWQGADDIPLSPAVQQIKDELQEIPPWLPLAAYTSDTNISDLYTRRDLLCQEEADQLHGIEQSIDSEAPQAIKSALDRLTAVSLKIENVLDGLANAGLSDLAQEWQELISVRKELQYLSTLDQELSSLKSLQSWFFANPSSQRIGSAASQLLAIGREWIRLNDQKSDLSRLPKFQAWRLLILEKIRKALVLACHSLLDKLWKSKSIGFEEHFILLEVLARLDSTSLEQNVLLYIHLYALEEARTRLLSRPSLNSVEIESELRTGAQKFNAILSASTFVSKATVDTVMPCITKIMREEILTELIRFSAAEILAVFTKESQTGKALQKTTSSDTNNNNKLANIEPQDSERVKLRFLVILEKLLKREDWPSDGDMIAVMRRNNIFDMVIPFTDLWIASDKMATELWMADSDWKAVAMNGVPIRGFICTNAAVRVAEAILNMEQRIKLIAPDKRSIELYTDKVLVHTLIEPVLQLLKNRWNDSDDPFNNIDLSLRILNSVDFLSEEVQQVLQDHLPVGRAKASIDKLKDRLLCLFADHLVENIKESEISLDPYYLSDILLTNDFDIISCNISIETARSLAQLLEKHFIHLFNRLIPKKDNQRIIPPGNRSNKVCLQTNLRTAIWACGNLNSESQTIGHEILLCEDENNLIDSDLTRLYKSLSKI